MTKPTDDLEAVRTIVEALESFEADDKERIIRWAREKLKLPSTSTLQQQSPASSTSRLPIATTPPSLTTARDLRTFVAEKQPKSDVQFAATIAFYHRFEAPADRRKDNINADDLREACSREKRVLIKQPIQAVNHARNLGRLDSAGRGVFTINSVGENLVAMTLPAAQGKESKPQLKKSKSSGRKTAKLRK
jgi:hypothetical protein